MPYGDMPPGFSINSRIRVLVMGLRDYEKPTECKVFRVNPDGTNGELIIISMNMK